MSAGGIVGFVPEPTARWNAASQSARLSRIDIGDGTSTDGRGGGRSR
jgi:hypothetical protein